MENIFTKNGTGVERELKRTTRLSSRPVFEIGRRGHHLAAREFQVEKKEKGKNKEGSIKNPAAGSEVLKRARVPGDMIFKFRQPRLARTHLAFVREEAPSERGVGEPRDAREVVKQHLQLGALLRPPAGQPVNKGRRSE